ncbi:MAG: hypothetical protein ACI93T_000195 [Porticoccaceae bacterium]|jgi:hypothetical protein
MAVEQLFIDLCTVSRCFSVKTGKWKTTEVTLSGPFTSTRTRMVPDDWQNSDSNASG